MRSQAEGAPLFRFAAFLQNYLTQGAYDRRQVRNRNLNRLATANRREFLFIDIRENRRAEELNDASEIRNPSKFQSAI